MLAYLGKSDIIILEKVKKEQTNYGGVNNVQLSTF